MVLAGFYLNLPAGGLAAAILILIRIPERNQNWEGSFLKGLLPKLDLPGFALFAPAAIMFLLALEYGGGKEPWNSPTIIGLFVGAGANFLLFLAWEYRTGEEAMIPLSMVAKRQVWTSMVVMALTMGGLVITVSFYLPIYFQTVLGVSPVMSGVYILPSILSNTVSAVVSGILGMYRWISSQIRLCNYAPPHRTTCADGMS